MERFKKLSPILGLILIDLILFFTNFIHGTFLIGWDNLMPEFDIPLNINRAIVSVWQGYRGLGNLDGLGNAATLMHTLTIGALSIFLSQNVLRYVFILGTHLTGGIGFYFLARKLTNNKPAAFLGAAFYMLNLGIIQMYFAPLEAFAVHFASLPWIALFTINALKNRSPKNLLVLFVASLIFSSQGFIPTIFAVLGIFVVIMHACFIAKTRNFKASLIVFVVFLAGNAFWLLPYTYSAVKTPTIISTSRINEFSTDEVFYKNKAHGSLKDVLRFKGFMIDTVELNPRAGTSGFFMETWKEYTQSPVWNLVFLAYLGIFFFGLYKAYKKKNYELLPFAIALGIAFIFLANDTPVFAQIDDIFRKIFPLLGEVFRFPFTKFMTLFTFCFSIIFSFGIANIRVSDINVRKALGVLAFVGIIFLSFPAFQGNFFSPLLRIPVPKEYLSMMKKFQSLDPNQRIALFPVYTYWDWEYLGWGDIGSGFQWYGIPQALAKRNFDPWSGYDEQFYNEISYAVANQDEINLISVLKKYDVKYILLDQNTQNILTQQPINYDSLKKFLAKQPYLSVAGNYGRMVVYEVNLPESFVSVTSANQTLSVNPNFSYEKKDENYLTVGNYVENKTDPDIIPLFPSVYTEKLQSDLEFSVSEDQNNIILTSKKAFPKVSGNYTLEIPSLPQNEYLVPVSIKSQNGDISFTPIYPNVFVNGQKIVPQDIPVSIHPQIVTNPTSIKFVDINNTVDLTKPNPQSYLVTSFPNSLVLSDAQNQEFISFDTTFTNRSAFYVPINVKDGISSIKVEIPKIPSSLNYPDALKDVKYTITNSEAVSFRRPGSFANSSKADGQIDLQARGTSNELAFYLPNIPHSAEFIMRANSKYISGLPTAFYTDNSFEDKAEVETKLSTDSDANWIVLPKSENYYSGYGFHFTEKSLGDEVAQAKIGQIEVMPFPAEFIRNLRLVKSADEPIVNKFNDKTGITFQRLTLSEYFVPSVPANSYLIFSQAYDQGWAAYQVSGKGFLSTAFPFIFGHKISTHVTINNWENGWYIKSATNNIVIVYLPQYFEYLGFVVTILAFIYLLIHYLRNR